MIKRATVILIVLLLLLACKKGEASKTGGETQKIEAQVENSDIEKSEPVEVKPKVRRERVEQSYFKEHKRVEAEELPELSMMIFGLPGEVNFPETEEKSLYFVGMFYDKLYILNISEEIEKISLSATDPAGKVYSKILSAGKNEFSFEEYNAATGKDLITPAVSIDFNPLAAFDNGLWTFEAFINDNNSELISLEAEIPANSISITPVKEPNPFDYGSSETFKSGETIHIFGNNEEPGSEITVALYRVTDLLNADNESILEAFIGTMVVTDSKGKYKLELVVGDDMPKGRYKIAHGKVIDGVNGFDANIRIK